MNTMKKIPILMLCVASFVVTSCHFNFSTTETIDISEINIGDTPEENKIIGNDLISYEYGTMIHKELKIYDNEVLKNITCQYFISDGSEAVSFRIKLKGDAKDYKDVLVPFFTDFVRTKLAAYSDKKADIINAIAQADSCVLLINEGKLDSLWELHVSTKILQVSSKEKFLTMLEKRNSDFRPQGEKTIRNRLLYSELSGLTGDFYVINFDYTDKRVEQLILEKDGDTFKLLGYYLNEYK